MKDQCSNKTPIAIFRLGRLITTAASLDLLSQADILAGIQRHQAGDWGDLGEEDRRANDKAVTDGTRVTSSYRSSEEMVFLIVTEADRSVTTVLLPEEC